MSTYETIHARPISYAEIEVLAYQGTQPVQAYLVEESLTHGQTLTSVTLTPRVDQKRAREGAEIPHQPVYAPVENPRYDPEQPDRYPRYVSDTEVILGHRVTLDWASIFGTTSSLRVLTTPEAEQAAPLFAFSLGNVDDRERIYVADSKAPEMRLTPVYGTEATLRFIVKGIDHEEVAERAQRALLAEFGDALPKVHKVMTRPVKDKRVNVTVREYGGGERLVAANILSAETSFLGLNSFTTTEVDPDLVVG